MGLLVLVLLWLLFLIVNIVGKEEVARKAAQDAERELSILIERKDTLEANLAELSTPRGEEAALRETFGVARPGEEVIIVVPEAAGEQSSDLPWWRRVFSWFGW